MCFFLNYHYSSPNPDYNPNPFTFLFLLLSLFAGLSSKCFLLFLTKPNLVQHKNRPNFLMTRLITEDGAGMLPLISKILWIPWHNRETVLTIKIDLNSQVPTIAEDFAVQLILFITNHASPFLYYLCHKKCQLQTPMLVL